MLPIFEKILELVVHSRLETYFRENNLLIANQSGFRKSHSCETAIQWLISEWAQKMEKNNSIVAIFLDFKRAFETIDRERLINKLKYMYGVEGKVLSWIKDYLFDRKQRTKFKSNISDSASIDVGVPQGSVLGPFLFLVYINDIQLCVDKCALNLYADDTVLFYDGKDYTGLYGTVNKELEIVVEWLDINRLKLNVMKSKGMLIETKNKVNNGNSGNHITLNGDQVEFVDKFKYLGIVIDNKLNFKEHVSYTETKIKKKLGYLSRVSKHLSMFTRLLIYNTIIKPHLTFCVTILYHALLKDVNKLQMLQNRGMRIILRCSRYESIKNMLFMLNWLDVKEWIQINGLVYIFKIMNGMMPEYMENKITLNNEIHTYGTRKAGEIHLKYCNKQIMYKSIFYLGIRDYNRLPINIKISKNVTEFKEKCVVYLKDKL